MKRLIIYKSILKNEPKQIPLPGHRVVLETVHPDWEAHLEGKVNGGTRLILTKKR